MNKFNFNVTVEYNDVKTLAFYEKKLSIGYKIIKIVAIVFTVCCLIIFLLSPKYFGMYGWQHYLSC